MRRYTDAEKAAYYKKLAVSKKTTPSKTYVPRKTRASTKSSNASNLARATRSLQATKEPGVIAAGGQMIGDLIHPAAGFLGGKIGHLVEKITGFGDYKVAQNSLITGGMSPPSIANTVDTGGVVIRHREFIADITSTTAFVNRSYIIQPGLSSTFPWLANIAPSWDQYRIRGMLFEFKSTSSDALLTSSTSTALGSVVMSTDYDLADGEPTDKQQMLNNEYSCSSKPSLSFIHMIECKRDRTFGNLLFTRSTVGIPAGFDQRLYDFARLNVATVGMQADGGNLGELWVTYEVELLKQQTPTALFPFDHFVLSGTLTSSSPLGSVRTKTPNSIIGGSTTVDTYTYPNGVVNGTYQVVYTSRGAVNLATGVTLPTILTVNCTARNVFNSTNEAGSPSPGASMTVQAQVLVFYITVTDNGASFQLKDPYINASPTTGDLVITRVSDIMD